MILNSGRLSCGPGDLSSSCGPVPKTTEMSSLPIAFWVGSARCCRNVLLCRRLRLYAGGTGEGTVTVASQIVKYKVDESNGGRVRRRPGRVGRLAGCGRQARGCRRRGQGCGRACGGGREGRSGQDQGDQSGHRGGEVRDLGQRGGVNWGIAKAAAEGSFEVTLSWSPGTGQPASLPEPGGPSAEA